MDVTFFENQPFYTKNYLQRENLGEEIFWNVTLPSVPPSTGIPAPLPFVPPSAGIPTSPNQSETLPCVPSSVGIPASLPSVPPSVGIPASPQSLNQPETPEIPKLLIPQPEPPPNSVSSPQISLPESSSPSRPMMTMHNKPSTSTTRGDLQLQPKLRVYSRRNISKGVENSVNLQHGHLSKPNSGIHLSPTNLNIDELDVPIALRKSVRTCTQHPMSNFVSYDHLSPSLQALATNLAGVDIRRTIQEALKEPKWKKAVEDKIHALEKK